MNAALAFWRRHLWVDLLFGLLVGSLDWKIAHFGVLHSGDPANLYIAVVSASAALGAFAVTPIAIVLALAPGPRLRALLNQHMDRVRGAMSWAVISNLLTIAIGIIGIAADSPGHPYKGLRVCALGMEIAALLAVTRLVWYFVAMLRLQRADQSVADSAGY